MGIPNKEQIATAELQKYFRKYFPAFKKAFLAGFKKWSALPVAQKMCKSMNLYVTLYFELTDERKIGFLITEEICETVENDDAVLDYVKKKNSNMQMTQVRHGDIENTGLEEASDYFSKPVEIVWTLTYDKDDSVNKIIAGVMLDVLRESIHNLNEFKENSNQQIEAFFKNQQFMDYYIRKMRELFDHIPDHKIITNVLTSDYENRKACGTICFFQDTSEIEKKAVCFDDGCCLKGGFHKKENAQRIRKLLEICRDDESSLAASAEKGDLIGIIPKRTDLQGKPEFSIGFDGNQWELRHGSETLLKYRSGDYYPDSANEKEELKKKCDEAGVLYNIFEKMIRLLEEKAVHGALVIIAEDAEDEAERLCLKYGRGIKILKRKVDEQTVLGMTNADGAVLFDFEGNCCGFNIILDGIASVKGEVGRGSRYNSAVNYIACDNIKATRGNNAEGIKRCAIVRSEDKEKGLKIISNNQLDKRK